MTALGLLQVLPDSFWAYTNDTTQVAVLRAAVCVWEINVQF